MSKLKNCLRKIKHLKKTIKESGFNRKTKKRFGSTNRISYGVSYNANTKIEGCSIVSAGANIGNATIGFGSLIGLNNILFGVKVGRFCSFAENVSVMSATHPSHLVSTNVAFYKSFVSDIPFGISNAEVTEIIRTENGYDAEIGNDVWIGLNTVIKGGVKIGDGAIIGMGSVVTKDVPPYAIVGGVPAKVIKYRFDQDTIDALLKIKWWDWPTDLIDARRNDFANIQEFVKKYSV